MGDIILQEGDNVLNVGLAPVVVFDPWVYDFNGDGYIDINERLKATQDYYAGIITEEQLNQVLALPAPQPFDPWVYDVNGDGYIDNSEGLAALHDYWDGIITWEQLQQVDALPAPPPPSVANLYGVVADAQTGYPISGVKVTIDSLVTYTDAGGNYGFTGLSPGSYTITFEKDGYETLVR